MTTEKMSVLDIRHKSVGNNLGLRFVLGVHLLKGELVAYPDCDRNARIFIGKPVAITRELAA